MAIEPDPIHERASRESTDWLILLQDEPDDPDLRRAFDQWLHMTPANAAAWTATQRVSGIVGSTAPVHAGQWGPFLHGRPPGPSLPSAGRTSGCAPSRGLRLAALALAACVALLVLPGVLLRLEADYVTGTAEIRTVRLADGSTVFLAPDSAIAVAYGGGKRDVRLLAGEAFFDVHPNPDRPFRVTTREVRATVLGTAFDVRRSAEGAVIAVQHGVVRVDHEGASPPVSERLEAGQSMQVTWAGKAERGDTPAAQVAPWRRHQLVAQDQPMRDLVEQLRPFYSGTIVVADAAFAERPVTGVYNLADPVEALRAIARAHGGTVRQITPWILMVSGS